MSATAAAASSGGSQGFLHAPFQVYVAEASETVRQVASSKAIKAVMRKRLRHFNSAIEKAGQQGDAQEAVFLLQDMIVGGIQPNDLSFLIAAMACIPAGRTQQALGLLDILQERGCTHARVDVYARALTAALKEGDSELACFLVSDARREVVYPFELAAIEAEQAAAAAAESES